MTDKITQIECIELMRLQGRRKRIYPRIDPINDDTIQFLVWCLRDTPKTDLMRWK